MPDGIRRHLAGQTLRNVCYSAVAEIPFVGRLMIKIDHMDIFLKYLIQFRLNKTINLRHLTQRIMSCYTYKMAIVS